MPPNPGAGLVEVDAGMEISQPNNVPSTDLRRLGHEGEFVRQCDIHVAVGVFHQLHHFRSGGIRQVDLTFYERSI
ncbi:hypothetical protein D3C87_1390250 [compost metagenome]